jgi:drug/metabolite transporter (DMT)-like permease
MIAERHHLPSGLTALVVAGVPLFVVALRWLARDRPSSRTLLGVAVGFVGLSVLLLPGARPEGVAVGPALLVVFSSLLWSTGSFLAGRVELPEDMLAATVGEMVGGGIGLTMAGLLRGESVPQHHVPGSAWVALAYLIVFGSVVAFTAYSWLLHTAPLSQVATYAYVNPVVAVVLGAVVAGESITPTSLVGGLVTLVAVFIVVGEEGRQRVRYVPIERQGRLRSSAT